MEQCDLLIVGAGAAGMAAARAAAEAGVKRILLVDRKARMGGILLQCVHQGFGKGQSGVAYAASLRETVPREVRFLQETTVTEILPDRTAVLWGKRTGRVPVSFRQMILATGCLEISAGALNIVGTRPRGVYTAGQMQEMMNLHGFAPEGPVAILGSGDLGLIMAKTLWERQIPVAAIIERADCCGGMPRNRRFLEEASIPVRCGTTVTELLGDPELEGVRLTGGEILSCRTLLIAAGMEPDRTLIFGLGEPEWLHLCGNCKSIHSVVESVIQDGTRAGIHAARRMGKEGKNHGNDSSYYPHGG